jgi:ABC-type multidrug transport system ATPase subunit
MKILRIVATGFAELGENYTLDFLPKAKVNEDDYENEVYALSKEIDYPHCVAFIGKNGSGKSTALRLIKCVYEILDTGHLAYQKELFKRGVISLDVVYVLGDKVRRYVFSLTGPEDLDSGYVPLVRFFAEHTYAKKVNPRRGKSQFLEGYDEDTPKEKRLPEDTSILKMLPSEPTITSCFYSFPKPLSSESVQSSLLSMSTLEESLQKAILRLLDASLEKLSFDPALGLIRFKRVHEEERLLLPEEASKLLSDGTKRGLSLFSLAAHALLRGSALVVDELEDNIHKYLATDLIFFFTDAEVNKKHATLFFSTHYSELIDSLRRRDFIDICRNDDGLLSVHNLYDYSIRSELSKSALINANAFHTNIDYEDSESLREEIKREILLPRHH